MTAEFAQASVAICHCGGETEVIDSRSTGDHQLVRRRRKCVACGERWSTYELHSDDVEELTRKMRAVDMFVTAIGREA